MTWIIIIGGIILIVILIIGVVVSSNSERALVEERLSQYLGDEKQDIDGEAPPEWGWLVPAPTRRKRCIPC